jgi:4-methyl-5(b-hydroxyethyl)-thiazole monophosphate biosynthesis
MLNRSDVFIFLANGFEETEAIATIDVLRRGNVAVTIVSITGEEVVTGSHGIKVVADALFEDLTFDHNELLILPGGMPGTQNLQNHEELGKLLKKQVSNNQYLGAICASPKVLGHLNLLNGKEVICYPGYENELTGATLSKLNVVRDGSIITAKGPAFTIEFGLKLLELLRGKEAADKVAQGMLVK